MALQNRFQITLPSRRVSLLATAFYLAACGSPIVESIDKLDGGPEEQAAGRHELVLAADEAIEPLIEALESGERDPKVRAEVAHILAGLMVRLMDDRSVAVIEQHLLEDPDPMVRGRIAETVGPHLRSEFFDLFLQAIADPSPLVQAPALLALSDFMGQMDEEQTRTLRRLAAETSEVGRRRGPRGRAIPGRGVRRQVGREGARGGPQSRPFKSGLSLCRGSRLRTSQQTGQVLPGNVLSGFRRARAWNRDIENTSTAGRCTQARDNTDD